MGPESSGFRQVGAAGVVASVTAGGQRGARRAVLGVARVHPLFSQEAPTVRALRMRRRVETLWLPWLPGLSIALETLGRESRFCKDALKYTGVGLEFTCSRKPMLLTIE